ncbi:hypothetical protein ACH5RR_032636 [Cinchona calisaya]|uniref:F-box domain-containing protein n=1 Tax=Cinchona calisaya TaxID=153742 RepID=A0ABD2YIM0_9GENT
MEEPQRKIAKTEEKFSSAIYEKILLRLEVKDLLKFKCVCYDWYDIISSTRFVQRHLELSKTDPEKHLHRIFVVYPLTTIDYRYFGFHIERRWNKIIDKPFRYPIEKMSRVDTEIIGSCDGLICLLSGGVNEQITIIWNPCSQELVTSPLPFDRDGVGFYWFGRDNNSNGYKLLLSSHYDKNYTLYELSSNSNSNGQGLYKWRKRTNKVICLTRVYQKTGTFFNGYVHWPCSQNRNFVVCYDLSKAKIRVLPAPDVIQHNNPCFSLGVLDGCLSAICKPHDNFEIWVIKNYSLEKSWTRLMELEGFKINSKFLKLLGTLRNGDLIVEVDHTTLERYYFKGKTPRIVKTHSINGISSDAITYVESLISPLGTIQLSPELLSVKEDADLISISGLFGLSGKTNPDDQLFKVPVKVPQKKYSRMEDYFDGSSDDDYCDRVYDDDEEVEGEDSDGFQEAKDETDFSMSCD